MDDNMETDLIIKALRMAIKERGSVKELIHHSDRGSQYTSYAFERELKSQDIKVLLQQVHVLIILLLNRFLLASRKNWFIGLPLPLRKELKLLSLSTLI